MNKCPYIVGNECDIDRCNAFFDRAELLDKAAEKRIRADERERTVKEIAEASSSKELNENIDYCMQTISLCEMTTERRKELCETLLSQRAMLTEFEKQIRADERRKTIEEFINKIFDIDNGCWRVFTQKEIKQIGEYLKGET